MIIKLRHTIKSLLDIITQISVNMDSIMKKGGLKSPDTESQPESQKGEIISFSSNQL